MSSDVVNLFFSLLFIFAINLFKFKSFLIDIKTCSYFLNLLFNFPLIKSDLFTTKIAFFVNNPFKTLVKSTFFADIMISFKSASSARFKAIFIPFFSISFFELLIPAVSEMITGYPSRLR